MTETISAASLPSPSSVLKAINVAKEATAGEPPPDPDFQKMLDQPVGKVSMENGIMVPKDMEGLWRIATMFSKAEGMKRNDIKSAFDIFLILSHGQAVGFHPVQAMNGIMMINGRTTIWGDAALALCRSSDKCESISEYTEGEGEDMCAFCECHRVGEKNMIFRQFSVEDAKVAGLWGKSQSAWLKYPKRMLLMRARSWAMRDAFADVLCGLSITEEVQDYDVFDPDKANGNPPLGKVEVKKQEFGFGHTPEDLKEMAEAMNKTTEKMKEAIKKQDEPDPATDVDYIEAKRKTVVKIAESVKEATKPDHDTELFKPADENTKTPKSMKPKVWETRLADLAVFLIENRELNDLDAAKVVSSLLEKSGFEPEQLKKKNNFEFCMATLKLKTPNQILTLLKRGE